MGQLALKACAGCRMLHSDEKIANAVKGSDDDTFLKIFFKFMIDYL